MSVRRRLALTTVLPVSWLLAAATCILILSANADGSRRGYAQAIAMCALFAACDLALLIPNYFARLPVFPLKLFCLYFMTEAASLGNLAIALIVFSLFYENWFFLGTAGAAAVSAGAAVIALRASAERSAWGLVNPGIPETELFVILLAAIAGGIAGRCYGRVLVKCAKQECDIARLEETVTNLTKTNTAYQTYATYIEETSREEERHRISREIHDIVGYSMTNLLMIVQAALYSRDQDQVTGLLQKAQIHINESLDEIRLALRKLRSTQKKALHGTALIRYLTDNFQKLSGIEIALDFVSFPSAIDSGTEEILYRMLQESMTNSFRHGKATHIDMSFWTRKDSLVVQIRDNGKKRPETPVGEGIGLKGMHERIAEAGGELTTETAVDGFTVIARIPLALTGNKPHAGTERPLTDERIDRGNRKENDE
jgi:signal transduction histidine kinase